MMRRMSMMKKVIFLGLMGSTQLLMAAPVSGVPTKRYQILSGVSSGPQNTRTTWDKMYSSPTLFSLTKKIPASF